MSKVKGQIKVIGDVQQVTDSFTKRELVITIPDGQYPQDVMFEVHQGNATTLLDGFNVGEEIELSYNLRGRSWTNPEGKVKYFNTLQCWKIDKVIKSETPQQEDDLAF